MTNEELIALRSGELALMLGANFKAVSVAARAAATPVVLRKNSLRTFLPAFANCSRTVRSVYSLPIFLRDIFFPDDKSMRPPSVVRVSDMTRLCSGILQNTVMPASRCSACDTMMAVDVETESPFHAGRPKRLFALLG